MKKIFIFLGCLILSASLFAKQPLVRLYMDDGSIREFDLEDIEEITHISRSKDMIMEVYQHDGVEDVYPAMDAYVGDVTRNTNNKANGFSLRCVRDVD